MNDILIMRRFLAYRWVQNLLATVLIAIGIALAVSVLLLAEGLHGGLVRAAEPFPMLMGAKGSPNQLVLNGVFLQDQPIGNIPYDEVEKLRADANVACAVPLAFGDSYAGHRIVGTEAEIFQTAGIGAKERWLKIAEGKTFGKDFETVIGAETARTLGLAVGDRFSSIHGLVGTENSAEHSEKYTVVGILAPLGSPYDGCILTDISNIWHSHEHGGDHSDEAGGHCGVDEREVSAVIITPSGYAQAMQLAASYSKDLRVQIVFPSKVVIRLFYMMGNIEQAMRLFSWGVIAFALVITACSLYWFIASGTREQGIMRALGATCGYVSMLYFKMGMAIVICGTASGVLLGHGLFAVLGHMLRDKTSISMTSGFMTEEAVLIAATAVCGAFCSWLPARLLAKKEIAENL